MQCACTLHLQVLKKEKKKKEKKTELVCTQLVQCQTKMPGARLTQVRFPGGAARAFCTSQLSAQILSSHWYIPPSVTAGINISVSVKNAKNCQPYHYFHRNKNTAHIVRNGWCCTVSGMGGAAQCQEWVVLHIVRNGWCCTVSGMGGAAQCQEWVVLHSVRNGWCCTVSGMGGAAQCQEWVVLHTAQCQEWVVLHSVRNGWCCTVSGMGGAAQCQEWVLLLLWLLYLMQVRRPKLMIIFFER